MRALAVTIACTFGCGAPPTPPTNARAAAPPDHGAPIPSSPPADTPPADAPPASDAPPVSDAPLATAARNALDDVPPACRGAAITFDTEESENPCLIHATFRDELPPPPGPTELEITAAVAEKSVAPGHTGTVVVTMTNKTKEPMLLYLDYTCDEEVEFTMGVFDAKKKRVDYISHKNCDTKTYGCGVRVLRIALDPGGSMRKKRSFKAKVTKLAADCGDVPAGPIKPGRYVLRVVTGFLPTPDSPYHTRIDTPLVVK